PAEERRELPVNPVRSSVRPDVVAALLARRREVPLADRETVAEVDTGVERECAGDFAEDRLLGLRLAVEDKVDVRAESAVRFEIEGGRAQVAGRRKFVEH